MSDKTYTLRNNSTGDELELQSMSGTVGPDVVDVRPVYAKQDIFTFDPGFSSTASCDSAITYIDGDEGVLLYRGYPVEQLADKSSYVEVCYLLLHGELPTAAQLESFSHSITTHTMINESMLRFFNGFHHDAHPMAMVGGVAGSAVLALIFAPAAFVLLARFDVRKTRLVSKTVEFHSATSALMNSAK